jgi:hypothetical protein
VVPVGADWEESSPSTGVAEGREQADKHRDWVGLRVGLDGPHDVSRQALEGVFV